MSSVLSTQAADELTQAIEESQLGRYHAASERLEALQTSLSGTGWPDIVVGLERATLGISQGLYPVAHLIAYDCAQRAHDTTLSGLNEQQRRLFTALADVLCFEAAMYQDNKLPFPALEAWETCLSALQAVPRNALTQECLRPYVLLEQSLCAIAAYYNSLSSSESTFMKLIVINRYSKTLSWALGHRMVFPAINISRIICGLIKEDRDKLAHWQGLLEAVFEWAPAAALGNIFAMLAETCAESALPHRDVTAKRYCVLALTYLRGSGDDLSRLQCRDVAIEASYPREDIILGGLPLCDYWALMSSFRKLLSEGHWVDAQRVLIKGAALATHASQAQLFAAFSGYLEDVEEALGGTRLRIIHKLAQIIFFLSHSGQVANVLETLQDMHTHVVSLAIPFVSGMHAAACVFAFQELGKTNVARFWARQCWAWWRQCTEEQASQGVTIYYDVLLQDLVDSKRAAGESVAASATRLEARTENWIRKDAASGRWANAVDGWCRLASVDALIRDDVPRALRRLQSALSLVLEHCNPHEKKKMKALILTKRSLYLLTDLKSNRSQKLAAAAELKQIAVSTDDSISPAKASAYLNFGQSLMTHYEDLAEQLGDLTYVRQAIDALGVARLIFMRIDNVKLCFHASFLYAKAMHTLWRPTRALADAPTVFEAIVVAEGYLDRYRRQLSMLPGSLAIKTKQNLAGDDRAMQVATMKRDVAVALNHGVEALLALINAKARSISDTLYQGIRIPETLMSQLQIFHRRSYELLKGHLDVQKQLMGVIRPENRLILRSINEDYFLKELGGRPELEELQAVLTGKGVNFAEVRNLMKMLWPLEEMKIKFVDWFVHRGQMAMFTYDEMFKSKVRLLDITEKQVEEWSKEYFSSPESIKSTLTSTLFDDSGPFRQLNALVAPLAEDAEDDDLLVLMPCRVLSAIPLHTLTIQPAGSSWPRALIQRHPIVYAASLQLFFHCLKRSMVECPWIDGYDSNQEPKMSKLSFVGAYKDEKGEPPDGEEDEEEAISEHIVTLASSEDYAEFLVYSDATVDKFVKRCLDSKLIHFHGHCNFDVANVLDQALVFNSEEEHESCPCDCTTDPTVDADRSPGDGNTSSDTIDHLVSKTNDVTLDDEDDLNKHLPPKDPPADYQPIELPNDQITTSFNLAFADALDSADDPKPAALYPVYKPNSFDKFPLDLLAMIVTPDRAESTAIEAEIDGGSHATPYELSAQHVFDLAFGAAGGPLVVLIACESGRQHVGPGDEPLGLATALLCAGASGVLGTLWKVDSKPSRVFSKRFYEVLGKWRRGSVVDEVDAGKGKLALSLLYMAEVYRSAVCSLMEEEDTEQYRFWAPFAMVGSPLAMWHDRVQVEG